MITIKTLPPTRWKDYRAIRLEAVQQDPIAFGASFVEEKKLQEKEWKERMSPVLFAVADKNVVGMTVYKFQNKEKIKHIANIYGVYVNSSYRSQGIGKRLMDEAIKKVRNNKNIQKINLHVNAKQKPAVELYKKLGFQTVGRLKKDLFINGKFYDTLVMEKYFR